MSNATTHTAADLAAALTRLADRLDAEPHVPCHDVAKGTTYQVSRYQYDVQTIRRLAEQGGWGHQERRWASQNSMAFGRFPGWAINAFRFLAATYVIVREITVPEAVPHRIFGEYAGNNTSGHIRPGTYPVVLDGYEEEVALVLFDGANHFWNRIGSHGSMRTTELKGQRVFASLAQLAPRAA